MSNPIIESEMTFSQMSLIEQNTFLKSILKKSIGNYSIIAINLDGVIISWNKGASHEYGYTASEVIGQTLHKIYDSKNGNPKKIKMLLDETLKTEICFAELIGIRKNGDYFTSFVNFILRKDLDESPIGFTLISPDLKKLQYNLKKCKETNKLLEDKNEVLQESSDYAKDTNRLKSELLANVSHELRVPLNTIIGFAELMYTGKVGPVSAEHKEYLRDILLSSDRLLRLINDLLDLNKIESGKMEFFPEPITMEKLIGEIRSVFYKPIVQKNIQLDIQIDPGLSEVIIDPSRFKQILYNYVSNALKFTPAKGQIFISVKLDKNNMFRLEVKDTGIGITKKDLKRLFTPYQQLKTNSKKKYQGTGLGLSLTKKLVEAQGGKVGVLSEAGVGSTFYAVLPCYPLNGEMNGEILTGEEVNGT
jgi:PAS domain S-box-containing protein